MSFALSRASPDATASSSETSNTGVENSRFEFGQYRQYPTTALEKTRNAAAINLSARLAQAGKFRCIAIRLAVLAASLLMQSKSIRS